MNKSILVFISHSSEDKADLVEPIVSDLENCYINVWIDKRKILPGENLRKSIFRDGLDKTDVTLIFFTENSLKSSWVDREIKHVLREEAKKGNNFDLNKIISIFDSSKTYDQIVERYPELTDDLCHLMPKDYTQIQFGQLVSAIWSKYLSLQGGDVETQRQMLEKDKEIFQKDKDIQELKNKIEKFNSKETTDNSEFQVMYDTGRLDDFIQSKDAILNSYYIDKSRVNDITTPVAFGLAENHDTSEDYFVLTPKGKEFFKWFIMCNKSELS